MTSDRAEVNDWPQTPRCPRWLTVRVPETTLSPPRPVAWSWGASPDGHACHTQPLEGCSIADWTAGVVNSHARGGGGGGGGGANSAGCSCGVWVMVGRPLTGLTEPADRDELKPPPPPGEERAWGKTHDQENASDCSASSLSCDHWAGSVAPPPPSPLRLCHWHCSFKVMTWQTRSYSFHFPHELPAWWEALDMQLSNRITRWQCMQRLKPVSAAPAFVLQRTNQERSEEDAPSCRRFLFDR